MTLPLSILPDWTPAGTRVRWSVWLIRSLRTSWGYGDVEKTWEVQYPPRWSRAQAGRKVQVSRSVVRGGRDAEIASRIGRLNPKLSLQCFVYIPNLIHGHKVWAMTKGIRARIQAIGMTGSIHVLVLQRKCILKRAVIVYGVSHHVAVRSSGVPITLSSLSSLQLIAENRFFWRRCVHLTLPPWRRSGS